MRARLAIVVLAACGSSAPPPAAPAPPAPAKDWAVAEPWHPPPSAPAEQPDRPLIVQGEGRRVNELVERPGPGRRTVIRRDGDELATSRADLWYPCVRELVAGRDAVVRDRLGDALMLYVTTCDRAAHRATFEPPHRKSYGLGSYAGFIGTVTPTALRLELRVVYRGRPAPDHITIQAGARSWTSPLVDALGDGAVGVPVTRALRRALADALDTDGAIDDIALTDEMKHDLRPFLEISDLLDP